MTFQADIQAVENWASAEVAAFSSGFTSFIATIEPTLANDASVLIQGTITLFVNAGVDIATGLPVGTLLTTVLNLAEAAGKAAITQIAPAALTAIASIHLAGAIATQAPANTNAADDVGAAA